MKPKKVPKREEKDGELQKLKTRVKRLEKENDRLKSELRSYEQAFKNTNKFLRDNTKEISLEALIKAAKEGSSLRDVQKQELHRTCKYCLSIDVHVSDTPVGKMVVCRNCSKTDIEKKQQEVLEE